MKYLEKYAHFGGRGKEDDENKIILDEETLDEMESRMYFILKEYYLIEKSNFVIDLINITATVL